MAKEPSELPSKEGVLKIWEAAHRDLDHVASVVAQGLSIDLEESESKT
jgi:hypothetical protein